MCSPSCAKRAGLVALGIPCHFPFGDCYHCLPMRRRRAAATARAGAAGAPRASTSRCCLSRTAAARCNPSPARGRRRLRRSGSTLPRWHSMLAPCEPHLMQTCTCQMPAPPQQAAAWARSQPHQLQGLKKRRRRSPLCRLPAATERERAPRPACRRCAWGASRCHPRRATWPRLLPQHSCRPKAPPGPRLWLACWPRRPVGRRRP